MKQCTGEYEEVFNKKTGALGPKLLRYVNPFDNVTIASACAKIFRRKVGSRNVPSETEVSTAFCSQI